jgi:hypothetical protein
VTARVRDASGGLFEQTTIFDLKAPSNLYPVPVSPSTVSNLFEDYQSFGHPPDPPYWHSGLDLRTPAGTPVLASRGGTVVKVVRYRNAFEVIEPDNYWQVAVEDEDGYIWQYHHVEHSSITVQESDVVAAGDTLGAVVEWNDSVNGSLYNHLHLNVVRWLGPGPLPEPYEDGFEYHNPLLFVEQPPDADTVYPTEFEVFFTPNENDISFAVESDPGDPVLQGDVDIVARLYDRRTEVPAIPGHPYDLGLYDLAYSVEPLSPDCQVAWIPRTRLATFDKIPGDSLVNTQLELLLEVYKKVVHDGFASYTTDFTSSVRRLLYTMTNGFFGTIDGDKGFWNTDQQSILGVHFPDGPYVVRLYASDFDGNELVFPIGVVVQNGLHYSGPCPEWISAGDGNDDGGGAPGLVLQRGSSSAGSYFGSFPIDFAGGTVEGSARAQVAGDDWPVWNFDFPADNRRIAVGVLKSRVVDVEYVPQLGDVILEVPAEAQSLPIGGQFDHQAPSSNPVRLRFSTRLARNEATGAAHIGSAHPPSGTQFRLVEAAQFRFGAESMVLQTGTAGVPVSWVLAPTAVDPAPHRPPSPLLRAFPNPFGAELSVQVSSIEPRQLRVSVLSVNGRLVRTLHDGPVGRGTAVFSWDGLDHAGRVTGPGVYFVRARGDGVDQVTRTVRIR